MISEGLAVYLRDASKPAHKEGPSIFLDNVFVPRVGDYVHYWLDCLGQPGKGFPGEPIMVDGVVSWVVVDYRKIMSHGRASVMTVVELYLDDYKVVHPGEAG